MEKSMLIISSTYGENKTFKLIPISINCPFNEVIYDPASKVMCIVGKEKYQKLVNVPKMNSDGSYVLNKKNTEGYAIERRMVDALYEYEIHNAADILAFVKLASINPEHESISILG